MADKRLQDFVAKTTPVPADLIYGADSSDSFREVKFSVSNIITALGPALQSIAGLTTSSNQMIYTTAADTYAVTALTPFARTILDDIDASTVRTTLGLVIGTNVQAYNVALQSIAGLTTAADKLIYTSAPNVYTTTDLTPYARTILAAVDASTARSILGSVIGVNVQAYNAALQSISGLTTVADKMIYTTASNTYATTDLTSLARSLIANTTAANMRSTLGLVIGTNVEPYSPALSSIAALTTANNKMIYTTGVDVYATTDLTVLGRGILASTTPAQVTTTINALPLTGGVLTGAVRYSTFPFSGDELVNKNYVDAVSSGGKTPAYASTTANLAGYTYDNGTGGIGATLIAGGNGAFFTDGTTPAQDSRIFVPFQTDPVQNGMYVLTVAGDVSTPAVLTRSTDYDSPMEIHQGDRFTVLNGTLYSTTDWLETEFVTAVGTDPINFTRFGTSYLAKANNLSDVGSASASRTNLGLAIGTNVQAYDAGLQSISGLTTAADQMIYTTALDTYTTTSLTVFGRTLVASADASAGRTNLGLVIGTDVQAYNANLAATSVATASSALITNNAGLAAWSGAMTNGQIIIGSTGATPVKAALTAGTGISITNGAGSITITSTATGSTSIADIFMMMGG